MRDSERSTFAAERLVKTTATATRPAKISRANRNNAACRKLDSRWTRMPADRETRLARRWDRLDEPRTSGSSFADAALQIRNVVGLLQSLQFS